jgi:hypothetical protein
MKIVEWLVEAFFTIKLILSPTLIGGLIGAFVFFTANSKTQIYLACAIWLLGLLLGIVLAVKVKRKKTATEFYGQLLSTPDIGSKKKPE